jgi:hypothetical protein
MSISENSGEMTKKTDICRLNRTKNEYLRMFLDPTRKKTAKKLSAGRDRDQKIKS